jgi:CTD small phosphatase-like protein 2
VTRGQLDNGIPITSWFDDPDDNALIECYSFLVTLLDVDDVRPVIAEQYAAALWM